MAAILLHSTDHKRAFDDNHIRENKDSDFRGELQEWKWWVRKVFQPL
jgi:hypothetical protein